MVIRIYLITINIITFLVYGLDKKLAKEHRRRISEKSLLSLGIIGGALGGLIGMEVFRHKTKKGYFYIVNILMIIAWYLFIGDKL